MQKRPECPNWNVFGTNSDGEGCSNKCNHLHRPLAPSEVLEASKEQLRTVKDYKL